MHEQCIPGCFFLSPAKNCMDLEHANQAGGTLPHVHYAAAKATPTLYKLVLLRPATPTHSSYACRMARLFSSREVIHFFSGEDDRFSDIIFPGSDDELGMEDHEDEIDIVAMAFEEGNTAVPLGDMGEGEGLEAVSLSGEEEGEEYKEVPDSGDEEGEGSDSDEWTSTSATSSGDLVGGEEGEEARGGREEGG